MDKQQITISQEDAEDIINAVCEAKEELDLVKAKTDCFLEEVDYDNLERTIYGIQDAVDELFLSLVSLEGLTRKTLSK